MVTSAHHAHQTDIDPPQRTGSPTRITGHLDINVCARTHGSIAYHTVHTRITSPSRVQQHEPQLYTGNTTLTDVDPSKRDTCI